MTEKGKSGLTTRDKHALDLAVRSLLRGKDWTDFGTYHVGTSLTGTEFRDVDVRTILGDDEFDAIFGTRPDLWSLLCYLIADHLTRVTGLPIDYQIQRQSEANEKHKGLRSALGISDDYAARGDATRFAQPEPSLTAQAGADEDGFGGDAPEPYTGPRLVTDDLTPHPCATCGHERWWHIQPGVRTTDCVAWVPAGKTYDACTCPAYAEPSLTEEEGT